jgi:hypothetical protein
VIFATNTSEATAKQQVYERVRNIASANCLLAMGRVMSAASVPEADPFSALPGRYIAAAGIVGDANGYLFRTTAPSQASSRKDPSTIRIHHPKSHSCKICLSDGRKSKSQTLKDAGIPVSSANDYEQLAGGRDASTITGLLALSYRTFRAKRILADRSESQIAEDPKLVRTAQGR